MSEEAPKATEPPKDAGEQSSLQVPSLTLDVSRDAITPRRTQGGSSNLLRIVGALVGIVILGGIIAMTPNMMGSRWLTFGRDQAEQLSQSDLAGYSSPVQELMRYLKGLQVGQFAFNWKISGEEAAKQLGFTRLFASAYGELVLQTKARMQAQHTVHINEIISDYGAIVRQEQGIDKLLARREGHAASIAYLRALQNGDVVFPGPKALAPVPQILLVQLMTAYPEESFDINDTIFAAVYRDAREFAVAQVQKAEEVWVHEVIGEFRRLIVKSAENPGSSAEQTPCDKGRIIGEITTIVKLCPRLRLSEGPQTASEALIQQAGATACKEHAEAALKTKLDSMSVDEVSKLCALIEQHTGSGKITAFNVIN